jgi:hypothetical protein
VNPRLKPGDFPLGSPKSRAVVRAQLERAEREPSELLKVEIVHIGFDDKEPLPQSRTIPWQGGVTEIIHIAGSSS